MYLSRLLLDPRVRQVQRELGDPYQLHRTIMAAFPSPLPKEERVLHRLDVDQHSGQLILLVQSQSQPSWTDLTDKEYLLPTDPFTELENPATKTVTFTFQTGQRLRFRLRANPIKRLLRDIPEYNLKKGQRIGLFKEEDQQDWLKKRGVKGGGFFLEDVMIRNEGFSGGLTKEQHRLKHFAVQFDGILQVTDPDKFTTAIKTGIGSGKAFGFGLLSIAPVR